ncbi:MAG: GNAT family N-acetyltransferase [Candidatus Bipolaricaulota bacterium]
MGEHQLRIEPLNPHTEDTCILSQVHVLLARRHAEAWPEDPPRSYGEVVRDLRSVPAFVGARRWVAWRGGRAVGWASVALRETKDNRHLADCGLYVHPEERRKRVGSRLLAEIARAARADGRRLLAEGTDADIPAGEAFARKVGAQPGLNLSISQLELAQVDRDLVRTWVERAPTDEFELGLWIGPYPEEDLPTIIALREVMNTAPREELDVEDFHWTPEHLRQVEQALAEAGEERWTLYCRHKPSGELAGYTEVYWSLDHPERLGQGDTGVLPQYRGRGLGKWLKAAMLERVFAERPQVKRIRTGNAGSNAPMLKINRELGFRERKRYTVWQAELPLIEGYLHRVLSQS